MGNASCLQNLFSYADGRPFPTSPLDLNELNPLGRGGDKFFDTNLKKKKHKKQVVFSDICFYSPLLALWHS